MKCPGCEGELAEGYVYLRGFGTSLHWCERSDVSWPSRSGLETIDLREYSLRTPRTQATCRGGRCRQCGALVLLRGVRDPLSPGQQVGSASH